MYKRLSNLGRMGSKALLLIAIGGAMYSCKDDYTLDDETPSWLGSSIYEYLDTKGNYTNFVKLIDDLQYKEVLARTGSKTLFVADDEAFNEFYKSNAWGVKGYNDLKPAQKKLLLNSAMINNAYLLEMMSSTPAGSGDNDEPQKGQCLRRETSSDILDSIPHLYAKDLPISYSTNEEEKDYWARFRSNPKGMYIALDGTNPMMTHFLDAQMANNGITNEDFNIIAGITDRKQGDAYIFNSKVVEKDITCQNGYLNLLDKVLIAPQNMAEVIRTNDDTKIFSHMLDRFSAPFYDATLTARYQLVYGNAVDSVWQKRYFSKRSQDNKVLESDAGTDPLNNPTGNTVDYYLNFDPGWNSYQADERTDPEKDMAVIFCPNDKKFMEYFFSKNGGGHFLITAYAPEYVEQITENETDLELVFKALDLIPRNVIQALLNNLMKDSFVASVPSKFMTIKNSAQDAMFDAKDNYHVGNIEKVLFANNGIVYVMKEVTTPADYASVSAPAYVELDKQIFNWAIQRGRKDQTQTLGKTPVNYYAYLLAMNSRFSFFVPQDENFLYVDPLSFYSPGIENGSAGAVLVGRAYLYTWGKDAPSVKSYKYNYDPNTKTGTLGEPTTESVSATTYGNRLKDMLETHTIIHVDADTLTGVENEQHYFISKNGAVINIENARLRDQGDQMSVKGGWQVNTNTVCKVIKFDDKSKETNGYGNGFAYMINQPILPTIESVYSAMYNNPNFKKFFELCQTDVQVLDALGFSTTAQQNKYNIFVDNKGLPCFDNNTGLKVNSATNVRFFNNYRYTIYIPTNEAMEEAEKNGLPTWKDLRDILKLDVEGDTENPTEAEIQKATAMLTEIANFVKYHFHDNSIFADVPAVAEKDYETATIDSKTGVYYKVHVTSVGNGHIKVRDNDGNTRAITADKNIIVRDYITEGKEQATQNILTSSSSAVIHGIDGVLNFRSLEGGRYDAAWSTPAKAAAFIRKYQIVK